MKLIGSVIHRVTKQIEAAKPPPPQVSDEKVAWMIERMAKSHNYIPSKQIVEPIRDYLAKYGLLLTGKTGVGKTFLMKCFGVRLYTADEIADYGMRYIYLWFEWTDGHEICIDDLGAERTTCEYGSKDDLLKTAITHREGRQRGRTHITTNLTAEEIAKRYGDRTLSRILGMCKTHKLEGEHRREPRPVGKEGEL